MSNEKSANYGNVEYLGMEINHQWSKSEEFERMFQSYIYTYITPNIKYFSLLRPWSELRIVKDFVKYHKYFQVFSSCNNNFKIYKESSITGQNRWCGTCPKCAFVFTLLAAYLPKSEVESIFGKDLYADANLIPLYKELLGVKDIKPFECVGTPEEVTLAFYYASEKKEFTNEPVMQMFESEVLPQAKDKLLLEKEVMTLGETKMIPEEFRSLVK